MTEQRQQTTFEISDRVNIGSPSPVPVAQLIEETDVWKYLSCMGVDRHMIHSLLINCMYTDDWSLDKLKQNVWQEYLFWHCVIAVVEDSVELSFKENMPIILENLNYSSVNVSVFLRKIRNKMKSVFKKKDLSIGKEQAIGIAFKDVGPLCEKEGISLDWLKNPSPIPNKINVTNGLIVELRKATEAMLSSNNNTLHTDGTKRDGREFGGLQIGTDSVNLASQAESGLKLWEQSVLESESFHQFTYNQNTSDFIRASTKLCVPGADEKSGYGQLFLTFLKQLDIPVDLKMSTFHGHRINLLFSMGAAVFFHREHIKEFIDSFFSITERNSLITSVYHYVDNPVYLAGCRAFGIVDKILTGPIWRIIESTSHILDLNKVWFDFKKILEKYSVDATELVEGKVLYPEYTVQDKVFESLFLIDNEELNILTTEALQIVLLNFCIIIERQLFDNLPGGILNEETEGVNGKELRDESTTVKPTNIVSERDFANLDRLKMLT
ncbi:Hypothetical predicted protein [Mytilus galloprovincialis]|uniref:Uncharacterized protein n=1 Tax=Mytilus galloprovincialis TaxID=29158 RepID=A0A8B6DA08_MYTGA|nr:Hypothetical predicted protein [Mytilus galloprovincialis]